MERGVRIKINHDSHPDIGERRAPKIPRISYTCPELGARRIGTPPLGGAFVGPGRGGGPAQLQPEPQPEVAAVGTRPACTALLREPTAPFAARRQVQRFRGAARERAARPHPESQVRGAARQPARGGSGTDSRRRALGTVSGR